MNVILDVDTPSLGTLTISYGGSLTLATTGTIGITAKSIQNSGTLRAGAVGAPLTNPWHFTLTGIDPVWPAFSATPWATNNDAGTFRAILTMSGGVTAIYSAAPAVLSSKLGANAAAAATALTTEVSTGWASGDQIALSPSGYWNAGTRTETFNLTAAAAGPDLSLNAALGFARYGRLQYPIDASPFVSNTQGVWTNGAAGQPTVIDERAYAVNLTRNGKINAPNDATWTTYGIGVHMMCMPGGYMYVEGVEFDRCGQNGRNGRYPLHWHMLSYVPATFTGTAFVGGGAVTGFSTSGQGCRKNVIKNSMLRAIVVHGTNGLIVEDNIIHNIKGWALFQEDGSEIDNVFRRNIVLRVDEISDAMATRFKFFDKFSNQGGGDSAPVGPGGLWITNLKNTYDGNVIADCQGNGIWNISASLTPLGFSTNVAITPRYTGHGSNVYQNNASFSNAGCNIMSRGQVNDDLGNIGIGSKLEPTVGGNAPIDSGGSDTDAIFTISGQVTHHGGAQGYNNVVKIAKYIGWMTSSQPEVHFFGAAGPDALIINTLAVGSTLNIGGTPLNVWPTLHGMASYHRTLNTNNVTWVNFPYQGRETLVDGGPGDYRLYEGGGAQRTYDLYLDPISYGSRRDVGSKFVGSHPGFRSQSANIDGRVMATDKRWWSVVGAEWDYFGYWGNGADVFLLQDSPFLTYGAANLTAVQPTGQRQGYTTTDRMFGVKPMYYGVNQTQTTTNPEIAVDQLDTANVVQGTWSIHSSSGLINDPTHSSRFVFRHASIRNNGRYLFRYPGLGPASSFLAFTFHGFDRQAGASIIFGVEWSGAVAAKAGFASWEGFWNWSNDYPIARGFGVAAGSAYAGTVVASMAALVAATGKGLFMWQDTVNNKVWVKMTQGYFSWNTDYNPAPGVNDTTDLALNRLCSIEVVAAATTTIGPQ